MTKDQIKTLVEKIMKKGIREGRYCMLLSTALILSATTFVCAQEAEKTAPSTTLPSVKVFQLSPNDVTAIIASTGALSGNAKRHFRSANVVHGFDSPQDTVTWTVTAPKEDDYVVSVLFSKAEQVNLEVSSGDSVLAAPSMIRTWEYRPFFWRQELPGTLHLKAGENQITFRLPDAQPEAVAEGNNARRSPRFGLLRYEFRVGQDNVEKAAS